MILWIDNEGRSRGQGYYKSQVSRTKKLIKVKTIKFLYLNVKVINLFKNNFFNPS